MINEHYLYLSPIPPFRQELSVIQALFGALTHPHKVWKPLDKQVILVLSRHGRRHRPKKRIHSIIT